MTRFTPHQQLAIGGNHFVSSFYSLFSVSDQKEIA